MAAAVDFETTPAGTTIRATTDRDSGFSVASRYLVLAAGGIENARVLEAAARRGSGFVDEHEQVGRYFMEHPLIWAGLLRLASDAWRDRSDAFDLNLKDGAPRRANLALSDELRRREKLLGFGAFLAPRPDRTRRQRRGPLFMLRHTLQERAPLRSPGSHLIAMAHALPTFSGLDSTIEPG